MALRDSEGGSGDTTWAAVICGDLYRQVLNGECTPGLAADVLDAILDRVDGVVFECHAHRLQLLGRAASPDAAEARDALARIAEDHPERLVEAYRTLVTFLADPRVLIDTVDKERPTDLRRRLRAAAEPESVERLNLAARLAMEGAEQPGIDDADLLALQYWSLLGGLQAGVLDRLEPVDAVVRNVGRAPDRDALVEAIYGLFTRNATNQTRPTEDDKLQVAASMASLFNELGDDSATDAYYELALEYGPNDPFVLNNYAYLLLERDDPDVLDRATRMLIRAYSATPRPESHIIDSLGWARYKGGVIHDVTNRDGTVAIEGAVSLLSRALELARAPGNDDAYVEVPVVADHAGDALWLAGRRQRAIEHWRITVAEGRRTLEDPSFAAMRGRSIFAELTESIERAERKIEAALADREPEVASTLRPVNAPGQTTDEAPEVPEASPDGRRAPDDTMVRPAPESDPG